MWVRGLKRLSVTVAYEPGKSHPVWVRGLKHLKAPQDAMTDVSHPVWVRGLKPSKDAVSALDEESHPVWVRGLKLVQHVDGRFDILVAPRVGAWIETSRTRRYTRMA